MKKWQYLFLPITLFLVFIILTILVKTVDVHYLPNNSFIGLYTVNSEINKWVISFNRLESAKSISDAILYISFVFPLIFAITGLIQWFKRKSLALVDKRLYLLLAVYVISIFLYFLFEIVKVNYSPYGNELKPSYPSTHVLIAVIYYVTGIFAGVKFLSIEKKYLKAIVYASTTVLSILIGLVRLVSGQHWFTDIIASYLLAAIAISLFLHFFSIMSDKLKEEDLNN